MNTARIITGADRSDKTMGRSAVEWRNDFSLDYFVRTAGADFAAQTTNKKAQRPVFEIHEREVGHREYTLTLMRRNNANKLTELPGAVRVGMFGKLLDRAYSPSEGVAPAAAEA